MFFYKKLKKTLLLEPMFLGPNMQLVRDKIFSEVEGTCIGKLGYIVSVSTFFNIYIIIYKYIYSVIL